MKNNNSQIYLSSLGLVNAAGGNKKEVLDSLLAGNSSGMKYFRSKLQGKKHFCGIVEGELPDIPQKYSDYKCRNNQLALAAALQIENDIQFVRQRFGADRVGVIMGTSTSGIAEAEQAIKQKFETNEFPSDFHYKKQEFGALSEFIAEYFELRGPSYAISTACSSSGKVFSAAKRLLELDICDAVVVGGADSLCDLTLGGFDSLEAISYEVSIPFSANRAGINLGEGAAVFLMTKQILNCSELSDDDRSVKLLGVGETSDAYHMSAPEPTGSGAKNAMIAALNEAGLLEKDIDYVNLHGTGTRLNDSMEALAINEIFGSNTICSSTKPLTGHTLGAAGATEIAICWLILKQESVSFLPPHIYDQKIDPNMPKIVLSKIGQKVEKLRNAMSNSFAFGGNNISVIIGL